MQSPIQYTVNVDSTANTNKLDRFFTECIGSCHAYLTLREDFRQHLRTVQHAINFKRIRCHGIFHDLVGVYHSATSGLANISTDSSTSGSSRPKPVYNFQNVDKIYDFFVEQGLQPYVELSFMPEALASGQERIFRYQANISPPADPEQWNDLVTAFVKHCIERYGMEVVSEWYFEVWNEPDLHNVFWSGSQRDYFELYEHTAKTIKAIDNNLKVGGPSTSKSLWIEEFLSFCDETGTPVDFVSTHHYCADASLELSDDAFDIAWRGQAAMHHDAIKTKNWIVDSSFPNAELHYTEWNVSPCHEDSYGKDSEFNAVFLLQTLQDMSGNVDVYSYWCISDIFEESGPGLTPFSGKYGLLNIHGVQKPSFHAFHFLSQLYDDVLPSDRKSLWVTRSQDNRFRILSWNYCEPLETNFNGADYNLDEQLVSKEVRIDNVKGRFRVLEYRVGKDHGNAYRAWQKMDQPQYPSAAQLSSLHDAAKPVLVHDKVYECDDSLVLKHQLQASDISFYDIVPI